MNKPIIEAILQHHPFCFVSAVAVDAFIYRLWMHYSKPEIQLHLR